MIPRLYHTRHSRSFRPLWLMEEMGIEFELEIVPYDRAFYASEEWRRVNPTGKIPVLFHGEQRVFESVAIMEYVMGVLGPTSLDVPPGDDEWGAFRQWMHYGEAGLCGHAGVLLGHRSGVAEYQVSDAHHEYLLRQIGIGMELLAERVSDGGWILRRGFSAADIVMGYTLHLLRLARVETPQAVQDYAARLAERPAFARAAAAGK